MKKILVAMVAGLSLMNITSVKASTTQSPTVISKTTIALSPAECKATKQATGCTITATLVRNSTSTTNAASYWNYAKYTYYECSGYGCWYWKDTLTVNVEYNGANVYNVSGAGPGCSTSGYNLNTTYCGYWYNGGNPYGYIDYIDNFNACVGPFGVGCFSHGLRIDIWKNGTLKDWYGF